MVVRHHRVGVSELLVVLGQRVDAAGGVVLRDHERALTLGPAGVVTRPDLVDRLDVLLADHADVQPVWPDRIPAEPVRIAETVGEDLTEGAGLVDERVLLRNAVLTVHPVRRHPPPRRAGRSRDCPAWPSG